MKKVQLQSGGYELTPALLLRLRSAAAPKKGRIWERLGVVQSTWKRWKKLTAPDRYGQGAVIRKKNLECIAKKLGVGLDRLLADYDFRSLVDLALRVDKTVQTLTRSLRATRPEDTFKAYRNHLLQHLTDEEFCLDEFLALIRDRESLQRIVDTIPQPSLRVRIDPNFGSLEFLPANGQVLRLEKPELLWDCNCETPGATRSQRCRIHSQAQSEIVTDAFRKGLVQLEYRGLTFLYMNGGSLWPPSVDSIRMVLDLEKAGVLKRQADSVLDLGSGTGFLGIVTANLNRKVKQLHLGDWLLLPALFAAVNWHRNGGSNSCTALEVRVGLGSEWLETDSPMSRQKYDLVLCNPPYLPILPGFERLGTEEVVAGTDLLEHVIVAGGSLGRRVVIQFSDLALPEARTACSRGKAKLVPLTKRAHRVPFRVRKAWDPAVKGYIEALTQSRGLEQSKGETHPLWHRVRSYEVCSTR